MTRFLTIVKVPKVGSLSYCNVKGSSRKLAECQSLFKNFYSLFTDGDSIPACVVYTVDVASGDGLAKHIFILRADFKGIGDNQIALFFQFFVAHCCQSSIGILQPVDGNGTDSVKIKTCFGDTLICGFILTVGHTARLCYNQGESCEYSGCFRDNFFY